MSGREAVGTPADITDALRSLLALADAKPAKPENTTKVATTAKAAKERANGSIIP